MLTFLCGAVTVDMHVQPPISFRVRMRHTEYVRYTVYIYSYIFESRCEIQRVNWTTIFHETYPD
jgi:hypothetical protein